MLRAGAAVQMKPVLAAITFAILSFGLPAAAQVTYVEHTWQLVFKLDGTVEFGFADPVSDTIAKLQRRLAWLSADGSVQRRGDQIAVEIRSAIAPETLASLIGASAQMTFNLVSGSGPLSRQAAEAARQPGELVYPDANNPGSYYVVGDARVRGQNVLDAQPAFDQATGQWVVHFRLDTVGAQSFAQVTQQNIGRQFAIILDGRVISAPVIQSAILGGGGTLKGTSPLQRPTTLPPCCALDRCQAPLHLSQSPKLCRDETTPGGLRGNGAPRRRNFELIVRGFGRVERLPSASGFR